MLDVCAPVTIVGNLNGKFYDLEHMFELVGEVPDRSFLVLGGMVNRGLQSAEVI